MLTPRVLRLCFLAAAGLAGVALSGDALAQVPSPSPSPSAATTAPAVREDVRKLYNDALDALQKNQLDAAYKGFREAWALQKLPPIAGNLGRTELKLGKFRDAAEHLALYLRETPSLGAAARKDIEDQLAQATTKVGTLRVEVTPAGAEVWLDGSAFGTAPIAHDLYLDPGAHTVEARLGTAVTRKVIQASPGTAQTVTLDFTAPGPPPSVSSPPPPAPVEPAAPSRVPVIILGGVGLAGLVAGAVSLGLYSAKRDEAAGLSRSITSDQGWCKEGAPAEHPDCGLLRTTAREGDLYRGAAPVLLVGGAVAAAAAAAYFLWWPSLTSPKGAKGSTLAPRISVAVASEGGAVSITGRF